MATEPPAAKRRRSCKGRSGDEPAPAAAAAVAAAAACKQENDEAEDGEAATVKEQNQQSSGAVAVLSRIIEHHKCPITQQLLVDPVVAEDGHIYERRALQLWLMTKKSSPTTNKPMGSTVVPALAARQTVAELVEEGMLDAETSLNFFSDRGRLRATRTASPGPDLEGARKDFQRSLELTKSPGQRKVAEFQLGAVRWMQEGAGLFTRAQKLQAEVQTPGVAQDLRGWMLDLGDAARAAVTWPLLEARRLAEWQDLPRGARVKVLDDAGELHRLCERPTPDAESKVGWNAEMLGFAGKVCTVQRVGDASHKNYILRRETPPAGRDFSFPYDALFLLANS